MTKGIFVTGIGTDVGKTIVSAILCQALEADYWKPVQTASSETVDREVVASLVLSSQSVFHKETYSFKLPLVPYTAAAAESIKIEPSKFVCPNTQNVIVVEGAGGLLVPLTKDYMIIDLAKQLGFPVLLVSKFYLGSINHTLLSVEALRARKIPILGVVFNGIENQSSKDLITTFSGLPVVGSLRTESYVDSLVIKDYANEWKEGVKKALNIMKT